MYRYSLISVAGIAMLGLTGCTDQSQVAVKPADEHAGHDRTVDEHDHGGGHRPASAELMVSTKPQQVQAGQPAKLSLMLHDASGKMLKEFDLTHEKLAHLILIREGLDEFAHVHPEVDAQGAITIEHTFPVAGKYHVFLDYQPKGGAPATARQQINVQGDAIAAPALAVNAPGDIRAENLVVKVNLERDGKRTIASFDIRDSAGAAVTDLQPYLGAMGHLVVVSASGAEYVHAHPLTESPGSSEVKFEVHFPASGIYKLWGQFQRDGEVVTVPAVVDYMAAAPHINAQKDS